MQVSNEIVTQINNKRKIFLNTFNKNPKRLYLGESEYIKLNWFCSYMNYGSVFEYSATKDFMGMKVFVVKEESHLNCA